MAKFCSLYSSSEGNCTYIGASSGGILIDIGVSAKKAEEALTGIGISPDSIKAIFITHEHSDHIKGVRVFASRHKIKVYATRGTLEGMNEAGVFKTPFDAYVMPEEGIEVAGIYVKSFETPHDSNDSCGYVALTPDGKKIAVATDIGKITPVVENAITGCDLVLLESNHDVRLLKLGPYPFFLKERILSNFGHLSNEACAEMAAKLYINGTTRFVLGHLSKENNMPQIAYETTKAALAEVGGAEGKDYILTVAGDLNEPIIF